MGSELGIPYLPLSTKMEYQKIDESKAQLKEIQNTARSHQQDHLEELAQTYAQQHNRTLHNAIVELIAHKESRQTFELFETTLKPFTRSRLQALWVAVDKNGDFVKDNTNKKVLHNREEIHTVLLKRNARYLKQASSTPFAKGSF